MAFQWHEAHNELKQSMQKEVHLMRDLLANLLQEELSLLMHDRGTWNHVMEERSKIVANLGSWRSLRLKATEKLTELFLPKKMGKEIPLEELLPTQDENSCEILSLRDQLMALADRMNHQSSRNQNLFKQVEKKFDQPPLNPIPEPSLARVKRKRAAVITYHFKE